jgi:hypothetical protein
MPRDIHSLDFAHTAAENMPYRVSVFALGAMCVSVASQNLSGPDVINLGRHVPAYMLLP